MSFSSEPMLISVVYPNAVESYIGDHIEYEGGFVSFRRLDPTESGSFEPSVVILSPHHFVAVSARPATQDAVDAARKEAAQ